MNILRAQHQLQTDPSRDAVDQSYHLRREAPIGIPVGHEDIARVTPDVYIFGFRVKGQAIEWQMRFDDFPAMATVLWCEKSCV
jgi:hypothetical protein